MPIANIILIRLKRQVLMSPRLTGLRATRTIWLLVPVSLACATVVGSGSKAFGLKVGRSFGWRQNGSEAFLVEAQRPFDCCIVTKLKWTLKNLGQGSKPLRLESERPTEVSLQCSGLFDQQNSDANNCTRVRKRRATHTKMRGPHIWFTSPLWPFQSYPGPIVF